MRCVGLDLSLTSTGISDGRYTKVVQTTNADCLESRLDQIVRAVGLTVNAFHGTDLAVIEAPAWSKASQTGHEELSALRVMVRHLLWKADVPYALVPPTTLKMATTGHGKATKQQMVSAVDERHGTGFINVMVKDGRYDQADAFALAAMGYARVGQPLAVHFPAAPIGHQSMHAVKWPTLLSDD